MFGIMRNTRIFLAGLVAMLIGTSLHAQNMWDAYRYSQQFNEGTARSVAMGNASVALGGDMGNISINPAASGVYRYHEFVITPHLQQQTALLNILEVPLMRAKPVSDSQILATLHPLRQADVVTDL